MQTDQVDDFAHRVSARWNRRGLLRVFAGGGVLAASGSRSVGQRTVSAESSCSLDLVATVRIGVNAGQFLWAGATQPGQIHGRLAFGLSPTGAFTEATFQLDDGTSLPVVGQATGYALQARIALGDASALILTGVGEQEIAICRGAVGGLMAGPQPGDLGDWQAVASGTGGGATLPMTPTPAPVSGCSAGLVWCSQACVDLRADPANCGYCGVLCGQAEICVDGGCVAAGGCSNGMTDCGNGCFDLNNDHDHCGYCDVQCKQVESCVAGACFEGGVGTNDGCPAGTTHCPGAVCVDLLSDPANCGACSMMCAQGESCWGGVCMVLDGCAEGYVDCGGLCVDLANDPLNCGMCGIQCHEGTVCSQGVCPPVLVECLAAGENCLVNWDCCSGICNSFDYSYTCA